MTYLSARRRVNMREGTIALLCLSCCVDSRYLEGIPSFQFAMVRVTFQDTI